MGPWSRAANILAKPIAESEGPDQESMDLVVMVYVLYLELLPLVPNRAQYLLLWMGSELIYKVDESQCI